jgi:hypothetical protein
VAVTRRDDDNRDQSEAVVRPEPFQDSEANGFGNNWSAADKFRRQA